VGSPGNLLPLDFEETTGQMVYRDQLLTTHVLKGTGTALTYLHHDGALYACGWILGQWVNLLWPDQTIESWGAYRFGGLASVANPPMPQFILTLEASRI
jgi:hypothetical protein